MEFDFDWVDAFADRPFGGNGCAVVHGGAVLPDAVCMAYVRETSLVECTFTGPSDVADVSVRYFLANREIPFAGHPTVATVVAMRARGLIADGPLTVETGAGIIPVEVQGTQVKMTQVAPQFGPEVPIDIVAAVGGLAPSDLVAPPQVVSTGLPFCIVLVKDRATVAKVRLDQSAWDAYRDHLDLPAGDMTEPFWIAREGATAQGDTFARLLLLPPNPPEDPFTGSATGAMAAYLWSKGLMQTPEFVAEQGHDMGRPGQARVRVLGAPDRIEGVEVSGQGVMVMRGTVTMPG